MLLELLGEGGQGAVWKAEDLLHPGTLVALKLVPLALSRPNDVERVRREARALARLEHPTLVACHALFEDLKLGVLGIAMDFVDGAALRKHEDDPRLSSEHRTLVLGHIAHVLAYVHQRGVSHRDLKLDNVLVTRAFWSEPRDPKNVKLVDFGIAKVDAPVQPLTQLDTIIGTLAYLAPEQLDPGHFGEGSAPATDVFAFGILGWRLLFGGHPSGLAANASVVEFAAAYRRALSTGQGWPPATPPGPWGQLLCECLALRARERIVNGEELARRCDQVLASGAAAAAALPRTEAFASSPTWLARPSPALDETVDLAPLAASASVPGTSRSGPGGRPPSAESVPSPVTSPTPRSAFPWLTALAVILGLGIAGGAAYYALFVNLPEGMPPPLPSSVGSLVPGHAALADGGPGGTREAFRDAMPADCPADAALCECCPSAHDCRGACDEHVLPNERWFMRFGGLEAEAADAGPLGDATEVCTRVANRPELEVCAKLGDVADAGVTPAALELFGLDLMQTGVQIDVYQRWLSVVPIARATFKGAVSRSAACKGLQVTDLEEPGPIRRITFYLDPARWEAGARCPPPTNPPL